MTLSTSTLDVADTVDKDTDRTPAEAEQCIVRRCVQEKQDCSNAEALRLMLDTDSTSAAQRVCSFWVLFRKGTIQLSRVKVSIWTK